MFVLYFLYPKAQANLILYPLFIYFLFINMRTLELSLAVLLQEFIFCLIFILGMELISLIGLILKFILYAKLRFNFFCVLVGSFEICLKLLLIILQANLKNN